MYSHKPYTVFQSKLVDVIPHSMLLSLAKAHASRKTDEIVASLSIIADYLQAKGNPFGQLVAIYVARLTGALRAPNVDPDNVAESITAIVKWKKQVGEEEAKLRSECVELGYLGKYTNPSRTGKNRYLFDMSLEATYVSNILSFVVEPFLWKVTFPIDSHLGISAHTYPEFITQPFVQRTGLTGELLTEQELQEHYTVRRHITDHYVRSDDYAVGMTYHSESEEYYIQDATKDTLDEELVVNKEDLPFPNAKVHSVEWSYNQSGRSEQAVFDIEHAYTGRYIITRNPKPHTTALVYEKLFVSVGPRLPASGAGHVYILDTGTLNAIYKLGCKKIVVKVKAYTRLQGVSGHVGGHLERIPRLSVAGRQIDTSAYKLRKLLSKKKKRKKVTLEKMTYRGRDGGTMDIVIKFVSMAVKTESTQVPRRRRRTQRPSYEPENDAIVEDDYGNQFTENGEGMNPMDMCYVCNSAWRDEYFEVNGRTICNVCYYGARDHEE